MEEKRKITVSLIIPVYKVSLYIERCLKSVIKQTYNHFECILVDDASPDDSIAKCEQIITSYEGPIQFRILHHQENRGLSAARNTGIEAATGDYLLFIDSDDLISNDCVEKLTAPILTNERIEMVYGGWMRFSDDKPLTLPQNFKRYKRVLTTNEEVRNYFFRHISFIPAAWNKLVSRDFLNRYDLRFREGQLWEDILWTFFVMKHLSYMYSIPDVTYFYYDRPNSISTGTSKEERSRSFGMLCQIFSTNFTPGDEEREAAHYVTGFCHYYIRLPKSEQQQETYHRFCNALPFRKYPLRRMFLLLSHILPHNNMGKEICNFFEKRLLRHFFHTPSGISRKK